MMPSGATSCCCPLSSMVFIVTRTSCPVIESSYSSHIGGSPCCGAVIHVPGRAGFVDATLGPTMGAGIDEVHDAAGAALLLAILQIVGGLDEHVLRQVKEGAQTP